MAERTIDLGSTREGIELEVSEVGQGGRPLLLVHGFTGAKRDFAAWLDALAAEGWHVVAPDLRGHGASTKPASEDHYSFTIFAADLMALVDRLDWDRFVVLGHSMGGMIVQELALSIPARIAGLILMDTSHTGLRVDPEVVALGVSLAREQGTEAIADLLAALDGPLVTDAYRRAAAELDGYAELGDRNLRESAPAMYASMARQVTEPRSTLDVLHTLTMPTLVLVGEEDEPFVAPSRRMADTLPDARLAILPGGGHSPQFEAPDAWWAAFSGFLAELVATGAAPPCPGADVASC